MSDAVKSGLRVLVIDDSATARHHLGMMLNDLGHTALAAASGEEGLALLADEASQVDAALCDLVMPDLDGLTVLHKAREMRPDVPVIIVTMHSTLSSAIDALRAGAVDYLPKPFDREVLARRLEAAMAQRLLARARDEQARLEAAMATAAATAHEINQPLTAIMASAQLIAGSEDAEEVNTLAQTIATEAERLGNIVHRLVSIAQFRTMDYLGKSQILDLKASAPEES